MVQRNSFYFLLSSFVFLFDVLPEGGDLPPPTE